MRNLKKFVRTPCSYRSTVRRVAIVTDVSRFRSVHHSGWQEVDLDLDKERRETGFNVILAEARKAGFAVIQK